MPDRSERTDRMESVAVEYAARGEQVLVVPIGASTGLGCLGYARAAVELTKQLDHLGPSPRRTWLFVPSSSCGTSAGLLLGISLLGREDVQLVGVSADVSAAEVTARTLEIARDGAELLGWQGQMLDNLTALDDQVGEGYGVPTPAGLEALELFARTEGLVLRKPPPHSSPGHERGNSQPATESYFSTPVATPGSWPDTVVILSSLDVLPRRTPRQSPALQGTRSARSHTPGRRLPRRDLSRRRSDRRGRRTGPSSFSMMSPKLMPMRNRIL